MGFKRYLYLWIVLIQSSSGKVGILFQGMDIDKLQTDNTIQIIEGEHLLFDCTYDIVDADVTWSHNNIVITRNIKLELMRIRIEDEGLYTCTVRAIDNSTDETVVTNKSVSVKILYPPSYPVLKAPRSFLFDEEISLTYLFDAEPEPTYQWRRVSSDGTSFLLSRNRTYSITVPSKGFRLYYNLQSLMTPTLGEPKSSFISLSVYINAQRKAHITSVTPGRYVHKSEGDDIYLNCYVNGNPVPEVWWTKTGDENFHVHGGRYVNYNIDTSVAGDYICHVENKVVPANRSEQIIYKTEIVHVQVKGGKASETQKPNCKCTDCFEQSTANPNIQSSTSTSATSVASISNVITGSELLKPPPNCSTEQHLYTLTEANKENDIVFVTLIVSTIVGWIVSVIMIGLNIYICKYKTNTRKGVEMSDSSHTIENQISNQNSDVRSSYVSNVRFTDNTYTDLTTYDQIRSTNGSIHQRRDSLLDWNDSQSLSTESSVITYIEPVSTPICSTIVNQSPVQM